jgi:hypothetical protein
MKEIKSVKEKIIIFLNEVEEIRQITLGGKVIMMPYDQLEERGLDQNFVHTFMNKLHGDLNVIRIISLGTPFSGFMVAGQYSDPNKHYHIFELKDGFDSYYKQTIAEFANNPIAKNHGAEVAAAGLKIKYSEHSREILLNDFFLISKPDFDSENEQVFHYLYKHPNRPVERGEIMENLKISITKDFDKIIENLKFKKDLRKAFFEISKDSIKFYNPVSKERLQDLGIKNIPVEIK